MALWILGAVFSLVGLPFIWLARRTFAKDRAARAWPRAPGKIVSSTVESWIDKRRDDNGFYYDWEMHRPIVHYTYTVLGLELEGTRIARGWDTMSMDKQAAHRYVAKYAPGSEVQVYYDPEDSNHAFLELPRSTGAIVLTILGGVWMAIGVLLLALAIAFA
jgi:hypothetical protein